MGYKMVIHSAAGPTGHFSVELNDGQSSTILGFRADKKWRPLALTTLPIPGKLEDDTKRVTEPGTLKSADIPLSKEEYDRAQAYFERVQANPGHYDLNNRNCVDFANGALRAAETGKDLGDVLSKEQKTQMNGAAVYQRVVYPEDGGLHFDMPPKPGAEDSNGGEKLRFPMPPAPDQRSDASDPGQDPSGRVQLADARDPNVMSDASPDTGPAPLDPPAPVGGLGNEAVETDRAMESGEQTANTDARIAAMRARAAAPIEDPGRAALLKPVGSWTEGEMKDVLNAAQSDFRGWRSGDPLKDHMVERVQDWHTHVYGDGPQQLDGGKPVAPVPIRPVSDQPAPHVTADGQDLWQASARLGDTLAAAAESDGYDTTVKGLQRGINLVKSTLPPPDRSPAWGDYTRQPPLVEDGAYGPKTDFAVKDLLSRHGAAKADDALALGRFDVFADNARAKGSAEGLDRATTSIFGPLYNNSDAPAGVLQSTLNAVGGDSVDGWEPLKEDRWIGPKTTDAFAQVVEAVEPSDLTRRFGQDLGLL